MARIIHVQRAQQRYEQVPVLNADGTQKSTPVLRKDGSAKTTKTGRFVVMRNTVADRSKPLPPLTCESCGEPIAIGTPYKHVTPKSGPYGGRQRNRHEACPTWRPSELSSSKMATVMAAQEDFEEQLTKCTTHDDIRDLLGNVAEAAREVAGEYTESADNMEDGFGHETEMSSELRDRGEQLESWADELESAIDSEDDEPTIDHMVYTVYDTDGTQLLEDEFDEESDAEAALATFASENDVDTDSLYVHAEDATEPNEEETEDWLDNLRNVAGDVVGNCPV